MDEILNMMVEINLPTAESFLKIKETLTRIGVSGEGKEKKLYPSCVILHKRGKYYISHFKLLFALDGKTANISNIDLERFKTIAYLIKQWGLATFVYDFQEAECKSVFNPKLVKIVPYSEKSDWTIIHKYTIGNK